MKYIAYIVGILILVTIGWVFLSGEVVVDDFSPEVPPQETMPQPSEAPNITPPTEPPPRSTAEEMPEPITISISQLPEEQQTALRTLGIDGDTITFTPEMVVCAEAEVGTTRLDEIIAGDTPSFGEGFTLVSCYRK